MMYLTPRLRKYTFLILLFVNNSIYSFSQTKEEDFFMGSSITSSYKGSVNYKTLTLDDSVQMFYNYDGVKLKDDIRYGKYGIDISKWQGSINWDKVNNDTVPDKLSFVIVKATQGILRTDPMFKKNFSDAKRKGFIVGAYHYYNQSDDPIKQAQNFINNVKLSAGDIMPIVDIEKNCFANCNTVADLLIDKKNLIENLNTYIRTVEDHFKTRVIIYTGSSFYNSYLSNDFKDDYFWLAKYSKDPPNCFQLGMVYSVSNSCYKYKKIGCWQYSQNGKIMGFSTNVDLNFLDNYYFLKWIIN